MVDVLRAGPGNQRGGLLARRRQRLLAQDVLARFDRFGRHAEMAGVGRADVDGVDRGIGEHRAVVGLGPVYAEGGREGTSLVEAAAGDGGDVDSPQTAQRVAVDPAHEPGPDDRRAHARAGHDGRERITDRRASRR